MKSKLMKKMTMSYKENPLHTECKGDSQYKGMVFIKQYLEPS